MQLEKRLETNNVYLRSLTSDDASTAYLSWLQDSEITSFLEIRFRPPQSIRQLNVYIQQMNTDPDVLLTGIFKKENSQHIGNIKLGPINRFHQVAEIGFLVGERQEWGKGYASEAIRTLCQYAFEELRLEKITAGCYEKNEGSRRALLKAGFRHEGTRFRQWNVKGKRQDGYLFGIANPREIRN